MQLGRRTWAGIVVVIIVVAALAAYFGLVLNSGQTSQPAVVSSVLSDPAGDVGNKPRFLDITSAKAVRSGANLSFSVTVSSEIPKSPTNFVAFGWFITSGVTSIDGPILVLIFDPSVGRWDASILAGRPVSVYAKGLSFTIEGNVATVPVSLQTLGNPQSFKWHVVSRDSPFNAGILRVDRAPDSVDVAGSGK